MRPARLKNLATLVVTRGWEQCCHLAFLNAKFHEFGILKNRLAFKDFDFVQCLAFTLEARPLVFGIQNSRFL